MAKSDKETLELMKKNFEKLELRLKKIELLLTSKDLDTNNPKNESNFQQENIDEISQKNWDKEMQFYCNHKLMDEQNIVVCGTQHIKKVCSYDNCPLKNMLK